jgi:hypothetical protein
MIGNLKKDPARWYETNKLNVPDELKKKGAAKG